MHLKKVASSFALFLCGTVCDVERRRVWAVGWNVERCVMWNDVECGQCGMECGMVCDVQ